MAHGEANPLTVVDQHDILRSVASIEFPARGKSTRLLEQARRMVSQLRKRADEPARMGEQDHAPTAAPATNVAPDRSPPAPKTIEPTHIAKLRRDLKHGAATAGWLRDVILPALETANAGLLSSAGSTSEPSAHSGLSILEEILERTQDAGNGPLIQQAQGIPSDLIAQRRRLESDYDALKGRIDEVSRRLHLTRTTPTQELQRVPAQAPSKARALERPKPVKSSPVKPITYTTHAAGPPSFDFGRAAPGTSKTLSLPIFNLVPQRLASAAVQFDGSPAIRLESAPTRLFGAGSQPAGAQDIVLTFLAPTPRGTHRGTVRVDLNWGEGVKPETLAIPVVGHSLIGGEKTDDEIEADVRVAVDQKARKKKTDQSEQELVTFRKLHPTFVHGGFESELKSVMVAMDSLETRQRDGINRSTTQINAYQKALPPAASPNLAMQLGFIALDIASAGLANAVAKSVEGVLKVVAKLSEPTIYAVSDSLKEGLKIGAKHLRGSFGSESSNRARRGGPDPRDVFIDTIVNGHADHTQERKDSVIHSADLLQPLLYKHPEAAIEALKAIKTGLNAEAGRAFEIYATTTIRRWFEFISELDTDLHRVGSVEGRPIRPARGVIDIGFQSGPGPRDAVTPRVAIMRGVTNRAVEGLDAQPLLDADVPIRLYGLPSINHAELLVTVTRSPNGRIKFVDETNGMAPGSSPWLKARGGGDASRGAEKLLREILSRSLTEQGVTLTTDQSDVLEH